MGGGRRPTLEDGSLAALSPTFRGSDFECALLRSDTPKAAGPARPELRPNWMPNEEVFVYSQVIQRNLSSAERADPNPTTPELWALDGIARHAKGTYLRLNDAETRMLWPHCSAPAGRNVAIYYKHQAGNRTWQKAKGFQPHAIEVMVCGFSLESFCSQ